MLKNNNKRQGNMTYKGYSLAKIKDILSYNKESGEFTSKISGKKMVDRYFSHRDEKTKKVTQFSLARLAVWMVEGNLPDEQDRVVYKDKDVFNLKYDNLVVVPYREVYVKPNDPKNAYLETEEPHIYVGSLNKLFVVRRGKNQSIYRTYDKDEAIAIRDGWLQSNKKLCVMDDFAPKWYKKYLEEQLNG